VRNFSVRSIVAKAQLGLEGYEGEDLWLCATCNMCVERCPRGVEIIDVMRTLRSIVAETGSFPKTLRGVFGSVMSNGNPWAGEAAARQDWAGGHHLPAYTEGTEYCFFTCCTQAYDPRNMKAGRAALKVLSASGVSYGTLGPAETCCGDAVRKAGGEGIFKKLAGGNIGLLSGGGVKKILVSSPHCLNTFSKEYPALGGKYEVRHTVQVISDLVGSGKIKPTKDIPRKAVYHDPCYLGRHNGIYEEPRRVLGSIPGLTLMEFDGSRADGMCCGGGGGKLWMETPVEERFAVHKLREAVGMGAEMIVTSCPYCISMFEDAKTALNRDEIVVKDVSEVVAEAI
jgi:Fe-S oxidoreductase